MKCLDSPNECLHLLKFALFQVRSKEGEVDLVPADPRGRAGETRTGAHLDHQGQEVPWDPVDRVAPCPRGCRGLGVLVCLAQV